ncbi:hypothetical protein ACMGDH_07635 [Sphingomonas sp. DT-207]|uniref:hypothetical protein n=1 Tax=Sphingomonas sp. DT-207 TaxID=3396167 RepID=UPI003F1BC164
MEQAGDRLESAIARRVLDQLAQWRPTPRDVDANAFGLEGSMRNRELLAVMEALCDAGLVMYEAIVVRNRAPCFRDAVITTSGYAALQAMRRKDSR